MSGPKSDKEQPDLEVAVQKYFNNGCPESKKVILALGNELANYYAGLYSPGIIDENLKVAAREGYIKALKSFVPSNEVLFSSHAAHCIISEIRQVLRNRDLFKVPAWLKQLQNDVINATEELSRSDPDLPTLEDIAAKANIAEQGIMETMQAGSVPIKNIKIAAIKSLRHETFKMPVEDLITIRKSVDRLADIQKKFLSLISENLRELKLAIEEEESALTETEASYTKAAEDCSLPDKLQNSTDTYIMRFPERYQKDEILRYFEVLSDEFGLSLIKISCIGKPEMDGDKYVKIPLDVQFDGRYRGLLQLLDYLRNSEKTLRVGRVHITRSEKIPARISTSIIVNTYYRDNIVQMSKSN